jgi:hypothetical protein
MVRVLLKKIARNGLKEEKKGKEFDLYTLFPLGGAEGWILSSTPFFINPS